MFIALGLGVVIIDNTILNVSTPYILRDLGTSFSAIEWAISGYAMTIAAVLITAGRFGESYGYKRMFIIGLFTFIAGSLIASEAPNAAVLIGGRAVVQAVGAAIVLTSALSLLATNFKGRDRAIAFGVWGSVAGASASIGPLLGGYLTTYYSWRWSLRINVLIGLLVLIGTVFIRESQKHPSERFDFLGALLSATGLFGVVFSIVEGGTYGFLVSSGALAWWTLTVSPIVFVFLVALTTLVWFIKYEIALKARGGKPVFDIELLSHTDFNAGILLLMTLTLGMFGMLFVLPLLFEVLFSLNAIETGVALLPMSLTVLVMGPTAGYLSRFLPLRQIIQIGTGLLVLGTIGLWYTVGHATSAWDFIPSLMLFGFGFGFGVSQLNNVILSSAPEELTGQASAVSSTARQIGSSVGIAIIGTTLATALSNHLTQSVSTAQSLPASAKETVLAALGHVDVLSGSINLAGVDPQYVGPVRDIIDSALRASAETAILFSIGILLLAVLLAWRLPNHAGESEQ